MLRYGHAHGKNWGEAWLGMESGFDVYMCRGSISIGKSCSCSQHNIKNLGWMGKTDRVKGERKIQRRLTDSVGF